MASDIQELHFLLIPLMSQSHIIPLTDFGKLLARRGVTVSIITTPLNATRFKPIIDLASNENLKFQLIPLQFPSEKVGLPKECENLDSLASMELAKEFFLASELLQAPLEKLMEEVEPKPNCIVSTNALPWTQEVATKFKIPRYVFDTVSCFTMLCADNIRQSNVRETLSSDSETFLVPDIPHKIEFTNAQLPRSTNKETSKDDRMKRLTYQMEQAKNLARGVVVNTFEELEPWYVEGYRKKTGKLWPVGPVSQGFSDTGNRLLIDQHYSIKWLDSMKPRSVIYVCFGSLCRISPSQLKEIGLGLEMSNDPFIWIIREKDYSTEVENWLAEEKFEERIEGRGLVIRGWAPQVAILSHTSVGGFLTHCGWNSTLEGVCAGVPMITWPMFAEQFYNEKFIIDVLEIGVRIGAEACMNSGETEGSKTFIKRSEIRNAVEKLMDNGNEGEERRKKAMKLGEIARKATEKGGSSYLNITLLIQDVMHMVNESC